MEKYCGKELYGIISTELGGENTADAFHVAAQTGKVIVDEDPADKITEAGNGKILFRGNVSDYSWDTIDGFTIGDVSLNGTGDFKGMELVVFALPAPKEWTTKKGLEVFGSKSFGFDIEYSPFTK